MLKFSNIVNPAKYPFFYGWVVLVVGAFGVLMTAPGQTIGVSAFTDHLLEALQISRDELSVAYMIGTMLSAVMLTKAGIFFDKFGAIKTAMIASIGLGVALLYLSQIDKLSFLFGGGTLVTVTALLFGFIFIRFFGQGVLTLASRTMVVKWFDSKRGLAIGVLSAITAFGHSIAPAIFDFLINKEGWSIAWIYIGLFCIFIFPVFVFLFYKREPEYYKLMPDGERSKLIKTKKKVKFQVYKNFTLNEARATLSLWIFAGLTALYGMVITGFTFHIVSIFSERGLDRELAITFFQPLAIVAVLVTLTCSFISDFVRLKYFAVLFSSAGLLCMLSVINLGSHDMYYWLMILGFGISSGVHPLIITLFLPRFYGTKYLGAITGQAMTLVVFSSAFGPILFSQSLSLTGDYDLAAIICSGVYLIFLIATLFTVNPQKALAAHNAA